MTLRTTAFAIVAAASFGAAFAQTPAATNSLSKMPTIINAKALTPEERSAAILAHSSEPAFDERTAHRMIHAIKQYKEIADKGEWSAIPADAKFALPADGTHVVLLRQRLIVTSDLSPAEFKGPYDEVLVEAIERFQIRNGLLATGMVGPPSRFLPCTTSGSPYPCRPSR